MWFWRDAIQGARRAAVRVTASAGQRSSARAEPQTLTINYVQVLSYSFCLQRRPHRQKSMENSTTSLPKQLLNDGSRTVVER